MGRVLGLEECDVELGILVQVFGLHVKEAIHFTQRIDVENVEFISLFLVD